MKTNGYVYLRINKHYVATVRNLNSLSEYLNNVNDSDESFGKIECVSSEVDELFMKYLYKIIGRHSEKINKHKVGAHVEVFRNQAYRHGVVVASSRHGFLVEYVMPNGSSALNVIKDLKRLDTYKSITYKRAFSSNDFGSQLSASMEKLVNKPQR